jgi:hypothetical protein
MQVMSQRLRRMNEERLLLHRVIEKLQARITAMEAVEKAPAQEQNLDLKLLVGTLIGSPEELEFDDKGAAAQTPAGTLKEQPRKGRQTVVSSKKPQK